MSELERVALDDLSNWWDVPAPLPDRVRITFYDREGRVIYERVTETRNGYTYMPGPNLPRIARVHVEPIR